MAQPATYASYPPRAPASHDYPKNPPRDRGYATLERSGHADRAPELLTYLLYENMHVLLLTFGFCHAEERQFT